jgi:DNA-binding IclR family transcriptional regulator
LDLLGEYPHGATLSDLSGRSGFPLSTTHRLLASLIRGDFASLSDTDRRYHLGLRVFALGQQVASARGFTGTVLPQMEWLAEQTGEAVLMSVLDGDRQLYVHYVAGPQQVGVIGERGRHGPLHCTSMGKVLLAFLEPQERDALIDGSTLQRRGPNTLTTRRSLQAELERVRRQGFAINNEELAYGLRSIAAPVRGHDGAVAAAVNLAVHSSMVSMQELVARLTPALLQTAAEISATAGYRHQPAEMYSVR